MCCRGINRGKLRITDIVITERFALFFDVLFVSNPVVKHIAASRHAETFFIVGQVSESSRPRDAIPVPLPVQHLSEGLFSVLRHREP